MYRRRREARPMADTPIWHPTTAERQEESGLLCDPLSSVATPR